MVEEGGLPTGLKALPTRNASMRLTFFRKMSSATLRTHRRGDGSQFRQFLVSEVSELLLKAP